MTETVGNRSSTKAAGAEREQAAGLTVERLHTTVGVHPYDEVRWERRDVVMTNWRDGTVNFEQRGVEFPDFWSVNATNIVTSKYFRGAVGSAQRESSLRQLIDRVVAVYHTAGVEHGYFATEADAEIFAHELTWMLLHQVFSFNSPVWFNVGTSSPQQVSACVAFDTLVNTPAGLVPIGKLVQNDAVGTKVFDAHGLTSIVATKANGVRDVLRLHTKAGHRLDVTPDHEVWKSSGEGAGRWVEAGTLRSGDQLEWHRTHSYGESVILVSQVAEAALAGWLQSDGSIWQNRTSPHIEAMTVTPAELAWVTAHLDSVFPGVRRHERTVETQNISLDCRRTRLCGKVLEPFIERWGLRARGVDMIVPEQLFTAPLPVVACYLRSLFQADGYVSRRERSTLVGLDMISEGLIRGVQSLLGRFGIFARVGRKVEKRPDRHHLWGIRIQNAGDRRIFADEIGFVDPGKEAKLEASFDVPGRPARDVKRLEIARIEKLGVQEVYDIQTESSEFLADGLRVHNCFILAVDDTMESILNWYREEGLIFKGGSGAGLNLSRIRSSKELLSSGGTASGPVSFMRGADASAGTIKSGGATRRAAKMVVLDVDHPDVEEFVQTKAKEEAKIRVLRDAGFDMDLGGSDITSVQYQNANNSIRVTDEFMRAVQADLKFGLRARMTGEVIEEVDAKKLFRTISQAAWECADPGMQYDGTINDWHTCPESGRITASNPCFPADQRVLTDSGLVPIGDLVGRATMGETFAVYTDDVTNAEEPAAAVVATEPTQYMVTGRNETLELRFRDGSRLRCTPNHRVWTANREWVRADALTDADKVVRSVEYAPRAHAPQALPARAIDAASTGRGRSLTDVPEKWTTEFAEYLGWLVGDGCLTAEGAVTVYADGWESAVLLDRHRTLLSRITGFSPKPSLQANGTWQLRSMRDRLGAFLRALGVSDGRSASKVVPTSVFEAPEEALLAFLRGLYDADGCVVNQERKGSRYVGLGSRSEELLLGVQELLASLGILGRIYQAGTKTTSFTYVRKDGTAVSYGSDGPSFDLRISGRHIQRYADMIGFDHPAKTDKLDDLLRRSTFYTVVDETTRLASRISRGCETTYNLTEPRNHSYIVSGVVVANCSEYLHLDNSSCNLASLNLLKFLDDSGQFDADRFAKAVELVITAMDISICFADFPTEPIGETTRAYRQLGIGYANLGALLMATGHAYDSEGGRSIAAAITSLMTGAAYRRSAELARVVGPYEGYARNAEPHQRVMRKHAAANDDVRTFPASAPIHKLATTVWRECLSVGEKNGWRNAQASVLAPTGCLTADTLVTTNRGLARLGEIGDVHGDRWQDLDMTVSTDQGPRLATRFFVNGEEPTRRIVTEGGYTIQGTLAHRIKVVEKATGEWAWRRMADVEVGDVVPMQLSTLVGGPRRVPLPVLDQAYYAGDRRLVVPDAVDADLAELVGYFMGDGSLHAKGIRFCVADDDLDVVERLRILGKQLFDLEPVVTQARGYQEVTLQSVRLARWWHASGFAKQLPSPEHVGRGWTPQIPAAIRETNSSEVYARFLRGLFEADGTVVAQVPSLSTASDAFAAEVRTMLLALGIAATTRETISGWGGPQFQVRVRNLDHALNFDEQIGFIGDRKNKRLPELEPAQSGNRDRIHLPGAVWERLVPVGHIRRNVVVNNLRKSGGVPRMLAKEIFAENPDHHLGQALGYLFEPVTENADGGVQPTYDLSVPDNVTYVAGGFVSHNTIGLMMDCDTTGIEPDLALVKFKKLVGGGSMQIVNQTVPRALGRLGYPNEQVEAIVEYVGEHGHLVDAPGMRSDHYEVFDCAMGERSIAPMGHVRMMAAVQPFLSGAISKCVVGNTLLTTADGLIRINSLHADERPGCFRDEIIEVASRGGPQKTDAFYYGGVQPVRSIVLRSGHRVTGTPNHRVFIANAAGGQWRRLDEVSEGDYVAVQYGADMWAENPPRFDDFRPSAPLGSQRVVDIPDHMTAELAFLLGAYASEGHTTESNWTVRITNSVDAVLERVAAAWRTIFGLEPVIERRSDRCPQVVVASRTVVEFLSHLGCGARASEKRIPDLILRSPRQMVLAFLQGLALDAYVRVPAEAKQQAKWAICLDVGDLLDDLQAVLTNLGIVHSRITRFNTEYAKYYDEVYASGAQARRLAELVPFCEPDKEAARRRLLAVAPMPQSTADVVPGIDGRTLYDSLPTAALRAQFGHLADARTQHVSRRSLEKLAVIDGVRLPEWVRELLADGLHFSPVEEVADERPREVYDISVPATHTFVGNGVVNHNTVNMPEAATVEDVEKIYLEGWRLGLKALAIYRDNCKVGQPLSAGKSAKASGAVDTTGGTSGPSRTPAVTEQRPVRRRLPKKRPSQTVSFTVGGAEGYLTAGSYPDGGLGEIFVKLGKQGSTLSGVMDAFSMSISVGLQYGIPLEFYVSKFSNLRFEPAGMTDDPDVRIATSVLDYLFRRLALDHLPHEKRAELGIFSADERSAQVADSYNDVDLEGLRAGVEVAGAPDIAHGAAAASRPGATPVPAEVGSSTELLELRLGKAADAPLCLTCGTKMRPAGSCYLCEGCGATSGCS